MYITIFSLFLHTTVRTVRTTLLHSPLSHATHSHDAGLPNIRVEDWGGTTISVPGRSDVRAERCCGVFFSSSSDTRLCSLNNSCRKPQDFVRTTGRTAPQEQ